MLQKKRLFFSEKLKFLDKIQCQLEVATLVMEFKMK